MPWLVAPRARASVIRVLHSFFTVRVHQLYIPGTIPGTKFSVPRPVSCLRWLYSVTEPGDPLAISPEGLRYQPPIARTPELDTTLPCYRTVRRCNGYRQLFVGTNAFYSGATLAALCLPVLFAAPVQSQMTAVNYANATPRFNAGHDYIQMLDETVNPANGQLSIRIQIPTPPGRGLNVPLSINYDSASVYTLYPDPGTQGPQLVPAGVASNGGGSPSNTWLNIAGNPATAGGWTNSVPTLTGNYWVTSLDNGAGGVGYCYGSNGFVFTDITGERHAFTINSVDTDDSGVANGCGYPTNNVFGSGDSAGAYEAVLNAAGSISIAGPDGTVYNFTYPVNNGTQLSGPNGPFVAFINSVEDRNGNMFTTDSTDTLGRSLSQFLYDGVGVPSSDWGAFSPPFGQGRPGYYGPSPANLPPATALSGCSINGGTGADIISNLPGPATGNPGMTSFVLPDGNQYQFDYSTNSDGTKNLYSLLDKITYPNGAYVAYTWGLPGGMSDGAFYSWLYTPAFSEPTPIPLQLANVGSSYCAIQYSMPVITHLVVSYDGVHIALTQDFSYTTVMPASGTPQWQSKTTTVTTNDLISGATSKTIYSYLPNSSGPFFWSSGQFSMSTQLSGGIAQEQKIVYQDGSAHTLRTVNKTWGGPGFNHLTSENTVLENGLASETDYCYYTVVTTPFISNVPFIVPTETDEFDYGTSTSPTTTGCGTTTQGTHGNLLRKIVTSYASLGSTPTFPSVTYVTSCNSPSPCPLAQQPISALANFPSGVITYNGSGTEVAETDYFYTNTVTPTSGVVQHDSQYAGSGAGANVPRGNVTKITKKCLGCTDSTTTLTYDDTGQVLSETDPCGNVTCGDMSGGNHKTTFSYTDNFSTDNGQPAGQTNAYVTQIIDPQGFTKKFSYGFYDGKLRSVIDENSQTTTYCYHTGGCSGSVLDPWLRVTQVSYPDGGQGTASYNDSGLNPSTTVKKVIKNTTNPTTETTKTILDGIGHTIQTQLSSDPGGTDYTNTIYDGSGHLYQRSNPTRCASTPGALPSSCSEPTYGYTTFQYDVLGRKTSQIQPDGSTLWWCYDNIASNGQPNCLANASSIAAGTWVDFSDESGRHWQKVSDAFDRLVAVMEPDASNTPKLETDYSYNPLSDLTGVKEVGSSAYGEAPRTRSFAYDSLSRLIASSNPETSSASNPPSLTCPGTLGTWTMCYGYDGNGNLQSKTDNRNIITSYFYDALNRLVSKTYSDVNTPSSCYEYDLPLGKDAGYNDAGRLVSEWTQSGACPSSINAIPSSAISWKYITNYDAMGRILSEQQCPLTPCSNLTPISYTYDLAGGVTSSTNGAPPASVPIALTYTPDAAGRLAKVTSSWSDATHPQTLLEADASTATALSAPAAYSPFGGLEASLYGIGSASNVAALSDVRSYDTRARLLTKSELGTPGLIATTVDFSMNPATFTTAEAPLVSIHVSCNSACGQVSLSVDGHPWIPGYDVDGNGNLGGSGYDVWYWQSPYLTPGSHVITANYLGNATYAPSSSNFTVTIVPIGTQQTSVNLSISPTTLTTAENAVVSAQVGCNSACGQVEFMLDGNRWVVFDLDSTGNTYVDSYWWGGTSFALGTHTVTANYLGNSTYAPSSQSASFTVVPIGTQPVSVSLSVSPSSTFSVSNIFSFPVHAACNSACTGFFQVTVDGQSWVQVQVDQNGDLVVDSRWAGHALFTPGTHNVQAHFLGNSTYAPSDSNVLTVTATP